ncbi:MAG: hypothetical protein H6825_06285 [Planctomycetes bacterium]|nr:hypothetical protein [Planctomycetota bacterium]
MSDPSDVPQPGGPAGSSPAEGGEALLAHARALDGLRDAQLELGRRLEGGRILGERVERLSGELERLREKQVALESALRAARRRGRVLLALVVLAALGSPFLVRHLPDAWLAVLDGRGEARAGGDVARAGDDGRASGAAADDAVASIADGDAAVPPEMLTKLDTAVRERNEQFAELVRLRTELFETRSRLADVMGTIDEVSATKTVEAPRVSRSAERTPDPLVVDTNAALEGAGVRTVRVLEAHLSGGALVDVLLADVDLMGNVQDARVFERVSLEVDKGAVRLRMRRASTEQRPGGDELVTLARWDAAAWKAVGLAVPKGFVPLDQVEDAMTLVLVGQPYALRELGGFEGGMLLDVVVDEYDVQGQPLRTLRAARAHLDADGPALVLEDGSVLENGDERPFYKGHVRLPLPGAVLDAVPLLLGDLP